MKLVLKYIKKYWICVIFAPVLMVAEVSVDLIQPKLMAQIVDQGVLGIGNGGVSNVGLVVTVGIRMVLFTALGGLCGMGSGIFTNICSKGSGNDLRKDVFQRIMHFSFQQTDRFSKGSLITRTTNDVRQYQMMVSEIIRGCSRFATFLIGGTWSLFTLDASFSVIALCTFPFVVLDIVIVLWKTSPLYYVLQKRLDRVNTVMQEDIMGARVVKAFVREEGEGKKFDRANQDLVETQMRILVISSYMRPVMNIVLNIAVVLLIYSGSLRVQSGSIHPGSVMAGVTYLTQIVNGMMMLGFIFRVISRGVVSAGRLSEVLETEPAINDGSHEVRPRGAGSIRLEKVSFAYPGSRDEVLHDISLEIRPGETLAVVGSTGCGKSTLLNLIPRFYDVTGGRVLVDGIDVRDYKLSDLRDRVAFVLQQSELFTMTVRDNIAMGRPGADDSAIRKAARAAQADGFIGDLSEGYDTVMDENGMNLSGGQRQRIAISRALLKKAEILILDDASSALDLRTEEAFYKALEKEHSGMTRIIVAHRIASIRSADRIAVMEKGTVADCGTHEELLRRSAAYREICESQMEEKDLSADAEL